MKYIIISIFAIILSIIWLLFFNYFKILDKPWPDVPPRKRVPTIQGVILYIWVLLTFLIFFPKYLDSQIIRALLWWGWILVLISTIDNFFNISPIIRLIIQILTATIAFLVWVGFYQIYWQWELINIPIILAYIATVFWFIFFINSINWFDWINWLASGLTTIGFLTIILLLKFVVIPAYPNMSQEELERLLFVIDISFVFFIFSLIYSIIEQKPRWLLRDSGITFLAYWLAFLSLLWWAKIWTILVVLSLVVLDAIWVFIRRIFKMKKNPMKWDYTHLHYRLLKLWWSRNEIKIFIIWWAMFWMILILLQKTNTLNKIVIFSLMVILFFWINSYLYFIKKKEAEYIKKYKNY